MPFAICVGMRRLTIGTVDVVESIEVTQTYECAAWYQKIRVQPGRYDMVAWVNTDGSIHMLGAEVSGAITNASFQSRLGAAYGRDDGPSTVGKQASGFFSLISFGVGHGHPGYAADGKVLVSFNEKVKTEQFASDQFGTMWTLRVP